MLLEILSIILVHGKCSNKFTTVTTIIMNEQYFSLFLLRTTKLGSRVELWILIIQRNNYDYRTHTCTQQPWVTVNNITVKEILIIHSQSWVAETHRCLVRLLVANPCSVVLWGITNTKFQLLLYYILGAFSFGSNWLVSAVCGWTLLGIVIYFTNSIL